MWKTTTLEAAVPAWSNVLDGQPVTCSAIAALHVSSADPSRIYAGCGGSTSSEEGHDWNVMNSGDWGGLMVSKDRGATWAMTPFPANKYITNILEVSESTILVSTQSELYDATAGGIWRTTDGGGSWTQVSPRQTFTLLPLGGARVLATHAHADSAQHAASLSTDGGVSWVDLGSKMDWGSGEVPFYTCATLLSDGDTLIVGGLTVQASNSSATNSALFVGSVSAALESPKAVWRKLPQPTSMDQDSMPKVCPALRRALSVSVDVWPCLDVGQCLDVLD